MNTPKYFLYFFVSVGLSLASCSKHHPSYFEQNVIHAKYDQTILEHRHVKKLSNENRKINARILSSQEEILNKYPRATSETTNK